MAFFTSKGRLRRRAYLLRGLGLYAVGIGVYAMPELLYGAAILYHAKLIAGLGLVFLMYLVVVQSLLRLHDLNLSAWWGLLMLLPFVSYILGSGLQFVQGTIGPNRFGLDPKRPGLLPLVPEPVAPLPDEAL